MAPHSPAGKELVTACRDHCPASYKQLGKRLDLGGHGIMSSLGEEEGPWKS
jgi:hypothetical protein